jgi:arylsulfatase A-like enzyme
VTSVGTHPRRAALHVALAQAFGLLVAFGALKALALWQRGEVPSPGFLAAWAACVAADAWVAAAYGALVAGLLAATPRLWARRLGLGTWIAFVLVVLYTALNLAFFHLFATPLCRSLVAMTGGVFDFGSSIGSLLTPVFLVSVAGIVAAGVATAYAVRWLASRAGDAWWSLAVCAAPFLAWGLAGQAADVEAALYGYRRNPVLELVKIAVPSGATTSSQVTTIEFDDRSLELTPPPSPVNALERWRGAAKDMDLLLVVLESTSAVYLKPYGATADPMPSLTRLADSALVFDSYYSMTPTSMKSLFSMMCSLGPYPVPTAETYIVPRIPCSSLPEELLRGGYRGALIHSGNFSYTAKSAFFRDRGFELMRDATTLDAAPSTYRFSWGIDERVALAEAVRFLDRLSPSERFFLMYVPVFPHHPYEMPPDVPYVFGDGTDLARYQSSLAYVDGVLGELLLALRARGRSERTLVVVVGDHGEAFYQHPGNFQHSIYLYDENIRVPLVIANPHLFGSTERVSAAGDHADLAPTLLDLLGLPIPERYQGDSLLGAQPRMAHFFTDYSFLLLGVRDGRWKYVRNVQAAGDELYDLTLDPEERHNRAATEPAVAARYRQNVERWYRHQMALVPSYERIVSGQVTPERLVYIEELVPEAVSQEWGSLQRSRSVSQKRLSVAGRTYAHGLGTHANAAVRYHLTASGFSWLKGAVGRDDAAMAGQVAAEIWLDGRRVFASGPLGHGTPAAPFQVDLRGAEVLELRALSVDGAISGDHLDWVDVVLR